MKRTIIYIFLIYIILFGICFSDNIEKVGTTAAPFLEIEVGPRAVAMGGGFVAMADDATSLFWNPSGIARLEKIEVHFTHIDWLAETKFDFVGIVIPMGRLGSIGLSITNLTIPEMQVRTIFYPEGTGEYFGANDIAMGVSYGRNLTDRFSIGFTAKYIQQRIWHMTSTGIAFDIGTIFTTQFNGMRIGMNISNFGGKMRLEGKDTQVMHDIDENKYGNNDQIIAHLDTDKWSLPLIFRVGIAMDIWNNRHNRISMVLDAVHPNNNTEYLNIGAEYAFSKYIFIRGGYKSLFLKDSEEGLTLGLGIAYVLDSKFGIKIDYGWEDFGVFNSIQRFGLSITF